MTCKSLIVREFKTKKADSMWPVTALGGTYSGRPLETCGGTVHVSLRAVDEPGWGSSYAKLECFTECSRCKYPYLHGLHEFHARVSSGAVTPDDVSALVEQNP